MADSNAFNKRMHTLFLSIGDGWRPSAMQESVRGFHDALDRGRT